MAVGSAGICSEVVVLVVVEVVVVLVGYWRWHSCGGGAGDSLCKAGSCIFTPQEHLNCGCGGSCGGGDDVCGDGG